MSAIDVQVRFAAEFALFLVSVAGLGFAFLRSDLLVVRPVARAASAVGFACLAGAALLSGALIVDAPTEPVVVALRFAGIVLLAAASLSWRPDRGGRELLRIGLAALLLSEVVLAGDNVSTIADIARGIGALGVGACLLGASARVISARIAASGALVVFAAITAVALALSTVVTDNIEDEALRRYGARADTESVAVESDAAALLPSVKVIAGSLGGDASVANALRRATDPSRSFDSTLADRNAVASFLDQLVLSLVADQDPQRGPTMVINSAGQAVVSAFAGSTDVQAQAEDPTFVAELSGQRVVKEALSGRVAAQGVALVAGQPLRIAAQPILLGGREFRGVVVRTSNLDDTYLRTRVTPIEAEVPSAVLALVDRDGVLASSSEGVDETAMRSIARAAIDAGDDLERTVGVRFLAARTVYQANRPILALVLSAPRAQEDATREDLYRVLFVVAMGAATAALVLAGVAGERIGSGLRKLTVAAASIQAGNLDARAEVSTDDEVGALGRSFDSMAASLRGLTEDLRRAAIDEAELRGRLEAVVAGMSEALVAVDADGLITDFNEAAEELFDVPAREARGAVISDVVHLRSEEGTNLARRLRRPVLEPWSDNGSVRISGGREVPVAISAGALRGPGNEVTGAVFLIRDERRERELDRMKTEFLANISHELRTPLTPIKGFASILQTRELSAPKAKGFAQEISSAADQLERVIGQLVNFSTIVGGRLSIDPEPVAVRPFLDGVLKPWRERITADHKLTRHVAAGVPQVVADAGYLGQALDELVDNAVKYSPDGGKIVVAANVVEGEDGPELEISVSDEGVGIPADRLDAVLGDFAQADASATRRFGGLGLGLALVQRIARAHGGDLSLAAAPAGGTRAALRLPLDGPPRGPR